MKNKISTDSSQDGAALTAIIFTKSNCKVHWSSQGLDASCSIWLEAIKQAQKSHDVWGANSQAAWLHCWVFTGQRPLCSGASSINSRLFSFQLHFSRQMSRPQEWRTQLNEFKIILIWQYIRIIIAFTLLGH